MSAREGGGSRYLYAPFDAASARIDANERVLEERWQALSFRLEGIEAALERLERRLWLAVFGMVSVVLAQGLQELLQLNIIN
ncbi:GTA head formation protein, RCAP_rcc01685 family [Roseicyclus sp.]|uniref:GTA head formation protein, RCAP_rcc01685 family n=1 Tax=Roseicyclus sp. TaxID=1914329 RepID=UPI003F6A764A